MQETFEVAVIGGGPAGMMAAATAASLLPKGSRVLLLEKNASLGKKLLITGGGRCNVTNAEFDTRVLLKKFKEGEQFLFSAFSQCGVIETLAFFNSRGMETKVEANKRVFPASNSAQSVWNVLVDELKKHHVEVRTKAEVTKIESGGNRVSAIVLKNGSKVFAKNIVVATGGYSHPETGSTGAGFTWLTELGHTVEAPSMALVPITTSDEWSHKIAGVSLQQAKLTLFQNNAKQTQAEGKMLFTHVGLSGPLVLNLSSEIGELLKYGEVVLELDLLPHLSYDTLNFKLQEIFKTHHTKKLKNALPDLIPGGLIDAVGTLSGINLDTPCNSVSREARLKLVKLLKHIPLNPTGLLGEDKAIITSGGVVLEEVDFKTMRSRKFENLYLVGDILNIDRPSGGYSLQLCWTTGFVAGKNVAI